VILPEAETSFFFSAMAQLEPELRSVFVERVAATLRAAVKAFMARIIRAGTGRRYQSTP
jgi:hypothetical protein